MDTQKFNKEDLANYLFDNLFNEDVYEVFPVLEAYYDEDSSAMVGFFMDFYNDLCDLSKPIVKPFSDERSTFIYRKVHGVFDDGVLQPRKSVGKFYNLSSSRVNQLVKYCDIFLINMFINQYNNMKSGSATDCISIEELGLSNRVYFKLKRIGINTLDDLNIDELKDTFGFGDRTIEDIEKGISRVRK